MHLGRSQCNDFSIGIELEGTDETPFEEAQYARLSALLALLKRGGYEDGGFSGTETWAAALTLARVGEGSLDDKTRALFQQWVESAPHRKNMVNRSFAFVSTGVIEKGGDIWAVQIFFATPRAKGLFQ